MAEAHQPWPLKHCSVCKNEVGSAHNCQTCGENVHIFCGNPTGEEGYVQSVVCFNCEPKSADANMDMDIEIVMAKTERYHI